MKRATPLLFVLVAIGAAALGWWLLGRDDGRKTIAPVATNRGSGEEPTDGGEAATPTPVDAQPLALQGERKVDPQPAGSEAVSTEPAGPPGAIHGRVLNPAGDPVVDAEVELVRGPQAAVNLPSLYTHLNLVMRTDEGGVYRFPTVDPNDDYIVVAVHAEFGSCEAGPIEVAPGQDKDAGDVRLRDGVFVHGIVSCEGRPLQNALVTMSNAMERLRRLRPEMVKTPDTEPFDVRTVTDAKGRYEFETAPFPTFEISAESDGCSRITKNSPTSFFGKSSREYAIDFELTPAARIAGQVIDEQKHGIAGAKVAATIANQGFRCEVEAVSDDGGRFVLERLAVGDYFLQATCEGFSESHQQQVAANRDDVLLEMRVQGSAIGIVIDEETGSPVTEFTLTVQQQYKGRGPIEAKRGLRFSDSGGRFEVKSLDPGTYTLEAAAAGYATSASADFVVERGQATTGVKIGMNRGGKVVGICVDRDGKPVKNALVSVRENGLVDNQVIQIFNQMGGRDGSLPKVRSQEDGTFLLELVVPETYQVHAAHKRYAPYWVDDIVVRKGETTDVGKLVLLTGARISGHAYDLDGSPLAMATVTAVAGKQQGYKAARTDAAGFYELTSLNAGEYTVTINSFQTNPPKNPLEILGLAKNSRQTVQVADGDDVTVDLRIAKDPNRPPTGRQPPKQDGR
jgi:protocatechuate 3,4-dioxygenase beta subunit